MLLLTKLYPEQVAKQWDLIGPSIEAALPEVSRIMPERMNEVLLSILSGRLIVYMFHTEENVLKGFITFTIVDTVDGSGRQLFIYSLYGNQKASIQELLEGFKLVKELAKGLNCNSIIAYTDNEKLKEFVQRSGGDTSMTLIRMEA